MFVTTLNFSQVLERFYEENKYDFLLLFVSSFDGKDKEILKQIVDNAKRIDKITGERICFFYFIQDCFDSMNEKITRWVRNLSNWQSLYGEGVSVTMETSDDICAHFGILRSYLPAFILVPKYRREEPQIISIKDYQDLESLLSPLNVLNSYLFDRDNTIYDYKRKKQNTLTQETIEMRKKQRISWAGTIRYLERKRARSGMDCTRFDSEIQKLQRKLEDYPELHAEDVEGVVEYPVQRLSEIKDLAINRLNIALNSHDGAWLVEQVENVSGYSNAVLKIWDLVRTRGVRISSIVEFIRKEIYERGFDVFISCKSQDYVQAHEVYEYLKKNGFKPFLADQTLKEIGVDQYTAVIGEVINVCQNMVVFATNVDYLYTPYVHAEWHSFVNDINTGHKPKARLVNVLSPDINIHDLPGWLRDKQCFTTENYKDDLLLYLKGVGNKFIEHLVAKEIIRLRRLEEEDEDIIQWRRRLEEEDEDIIQWRRRHAEEDEDIIQWRRRHAEEAKHFIQMKSVSYFPSLPKDFSRGNLVGQLIGELFEPRHFLCFPRPFGKKTYQAFSSIFAPAEIKPNSLMLVQVYLHLLEETEEVVSLAKESQKNAERRDYIPLQCKLKKGDKVDVLLYIYGESLLMSDKKSMVWQGSFTKCSFDYRVPKDIDVDELSCKAILAVGGVPVGEMNFITSIVDEPMQLHPEIISHNYRKVFISYAHKDEQAVKFLAKGLEVMNIDHFFDRRNLKAGDIFPQEIRNYINSADLFILCWSENASQSEYVKKEYMQALERAYPQVKPQKDAKLSIYPISIEPRAELPDVMKENYHFGEV